MYDHFRRARREERARSLWPWSDERTPPSGADDDVARSFGSLKERERALLWLAYVEEWRHDEMASCLGVRPGSVRVMLFRAKTALARLLRQRGLGPKETS